MAKLICTGSTLKNDLNNMKEVNSILEKTCRYYRRKSDNLSLLSDLLILLFIISALAFLVSCCLTGFKKGQMLSAALILVVFIILMSKLDKYNSQFYFKPYRNLEKKMYTSDDICIKEAGLEGENYTLNLLKQLDDSYSIIKIGTVKRFI